MRYFIQPPPAPTAVSPGDRWYDQSLGLEYVWINNGTSGSSNYQWVTPNAVLNGTSGTSGMVGTSGTSGLNGTSGSTGTSGSSGTNGYSGTSGSSGTNGYSGTSGTKNVGEMN